MPPSAPYRPPLTPAYWAAGGVLIGQLLAAPCADAPLCSGATALVVLAVAAAAHWPTRPWLHSVALVLVAAAIGQAQMRAAASPPSAADDVAQAAGARAWVRGTVAERPTRSAGRTRLVVETQALRRGATWQSAHGRVLITVAKATAGWHRGDGLEAVLGLRQVRNFGNPGEFDYAAYLARRDIHVSAFAADDASWRRHSVGRRGWAERLDAWRDATSAAIQRSLDARTAPIVAALLVGEQDGVSEAVRDSYARAGVSHVLSISGLHIGLVAMASFVALRWCLARSERLLLIANVPKLAMAASLLPVLLYAGLAGPNVATLRAELMWLLLTGAVLLDRPRDWLAPLAAAAAALAFTQPGIASDISFQLSFAAVLGIAVGLPRAAARWAAWEEAHLIRLRRGPWQWLRWLVLSQAVTASALLATAPLTAWHFNQVSLVAPLANLLVVPLLGVVTVGVGLLATVAVAAAPAAAAPLFAVVGVAVRLADALTGWLAALPAAALRVPTPSAIELGLYYGALAAWRLPSRRWRRLALTCCGAALFVDACAWGLDRYASGVLRVTFLSVGQGDCTLIEFPGAHVMVVDGGGLAAGRFDVGRYVVGPALWRRKIMRVDSMILTHADFDHYGGLRFLTEAFAPRTLWWNGVAGSGEHFAALWRALARGGVAITVPTAGSRRWIDGVHVEVLHPGVRRGGSENDDSLTIRLRYGAASVLLPGDLEAAGEAVAVARWGDALASTILKVPHHGSRSSSSARFLDRVAPRLAVASLGAANRFGFPAAEIERAYADRLVPLWRTDRDGAVSLTLTARGAIRLTTGRGGRVDLDPPAAGRSGVG